MSWTWVGQWFPKKAPCSLWHSYMNAYYITKFSLMQHQLNSKYELLYARELINCKHLFFNFHNSSYVNVQTRKSIFQNKNLSWNQEIFLPFFLFSLSLSVSLFISRHSRQRNGLTGLRGKGNTFSRQILFQVLRDSQDIYGLGVRGKKLVYPKTWTLFLLQNTPLA